MLVALASAKGAPGVTTTALALAAVWPRPSVLADLDPAGGDLAVRFRDLRGRPLEPRTGLLSLTAALRRDERAPLAEHLQVVRGGLPVLVGVSTPEQLATVGALWHRVVDALADGTGDVIADCGRVVGASPVQAVLRAADVVLLVARNRVTEVAHLRARLRALDHAEWRATVGVVVVAERSRQDAAEVRQLLQSSGLAIPVVGAVASDHRGAVALEEAERWRASRSPLVRSARELAARVQASVAGEAVAGSQA